MRLLSIDPGAERCGWAVLDSGEGWHTEAGLGSGPVYLESGVLRFHRGSLGFQDYRLQLEEITFHRLNSLIGFHQPHIIVNEIIPAVGGGNFVAATQSYLANCACTTAHSVALMHSVDCDQISARTVHKAMVGVTPKGTKVSKVKIRNAVVERFPNLVDRVKDWVKEFDEPDAIAIGLSYIELH